MSSQEYKIEVFPREEISGPGLRQLRVEGFVPGIFYALDQPEAIPFKVDMKELKLALQSEALIYHISVGGKKRNVLIKEIQYHYVSDEIIHVDFQGVRMDAIVEVGVPIHALGRPVGVKDEGGQLHMALLEILLRCRVSDIPAHIEIDISELHIGDAIHAGDLEIGDAELVTPSDTAVLSVARPRAIEEEALEAEEEVEEFLFDEEAEGEAGAKPADADEAEASKE